MFKKLCIAVLIGLLLTGVYAVAAAKKATTVMVYLCGSNLESDYGSAVNDVTEMLTSGFSTDDTQVYILAGGSQSWSDTANFSPDHLTLAKIDKKSRGSGLRLVNLEELDNQSMGDATTLSYFLNYAYRNAPADRYILILWDHGDGPLGGVCRDENYNSDSLSMEEITSALYASPFALDKLEVIGFDACLMGNLEVACALSPYAEYMVASEETEPGCGWDYAWLNGLENDATGADTGRRIVDLYIDSQFGSSSVLTMSCIDLNKAVPLMTAVDKAFAGIGDGMTKESFGRFSVSRRDSRGFGRAYGGGADYDLVDLKSLLESESMLPSSKDALNAIDDAVIYARSNADHCGGLSVYHPFYSADLYAAGRGSIYADLGFSRSYTDYLSTFVAYETGAAFVGWSDLAPLETQDYRTFTLHLTPEQQSATYKVEMVLLMQYDFISGYVPLGKSAPLPIGADGTVSTEYNGRALYLNGMEEPVGYILTDGGHYRVPFYTDENIIHYAYLDLIEGENPDELELSAVYVRDPATLVYSNRNEFELEDHHNFVFWYDPILPTRYENGVLYGTDGWQKNNSVLLSNDTENPDFLPAYFKDELPGSYRFFVTFQITDTQNRTYCTEPVEYKNSANTTVHATKSPESVLMPKLRLTDASVTAYSLDDNLTLRLSLTNTTAKDMRLECRQIAINGLVQNCRMYDTIEAGASCVLAESFKISELMGISAVENVRIYITLTTNGTEQAQCIVLTPDEPLQISSETPLCTDDAIGFGEKNGIGVYVFSAAEKEDGCVEMEVAVRNGTDHSVTVDGSKDFALHDTLSSDWVWSWTDFNSDSSIVPSGCTVLGKISVSGNKSEKISLSWDEHYDGLSTRHFLSFLGIDTLDGFSFMGADVTLREPLKLTPESTELTEGLPLFETNKSAFSLQQVRIEPVGNAWVVGMLIDCRATDNVAKKALDWMLNGEERSSSLLYDQVYLVFDHDPQNDVTRKSIWLYFTLDTLPENGISSVGFTTQQYKSGKSGAEAWLYRFEFALPEPVLTCTEPIPFEAGQIGLTCTEEFLGTVNAASSSSQPEDSGTPAPEMNVSVDLPQNDYIEFVSASARWNNAGDELTVSVEIKNKTDSSLRIEGDLLLCNGMSYFTNISTRPDAQETRTLQYRFVTPEKNSYSGISLYNTDLLDSFSQTLDISISDTHVDSPVITVHTDIDTSSVNYHGSMSVKGAAIIGDIECPAELLALNTTENGEIDGWMLIRNPTVDTVINAYWDDINVFAGVCYAGFMSEAEGTSSAIDIAPGTARLFHFTISNRPINDAYYNDPDLGYGQVITHYGISKIDRLLLLSNSNLRDVRWMEWEFESPLPVEPDMTERNGKTLIDYNGIQADLTEISIKKFSHYSEDSSLFEGYQTLLCLRVKLTNKSNFSESPAPFEWVINGIPLENSGSLRPNLLYSEYLPIGATAEAVYTFILPDDIEQIESITLNMGLDFAWPNQSPAVIELSQPLMVTDGETIPSEGFTVTPCVF